MGGSSDDGQKTLLLHLCLLSGCYKNTAMEARITHHAALCVGDALRHNDVKIPAACVAEIHNPKPLTFYLQPASLKCASGWSARKEQARLQVKD